MHILDLSIKPIEHSTFHNPIFKLDMASRTPFSAILFLFLSLYLLLFTSMSSADCNACAADIDNLVATGNSPSVDNIFNCCVVEAIQWETQCLCDIVRSRSSDPEALKANIINLCQIIFPGNVIFGCVWWTEYLKLFMQVCGMVCWEFGMFIGIGTYLYIALLISRLRICFLLLKSCRYSPKFVH